MLINIYQFDETKVLLTGLIILALAIQTNLVSLIYLRYRYKKEFIIDYILFSLIVLIPIIMSITYLLHKMPYIMKNDILDNNYFSIFIVIVLGAIYFRSPLKIIKLIRDKGNLINNMSIREAIDNMDTGILVYSDNGSIILINEKMKELLKIHLGEIYRNGNEIWEGINKYCDSEETDSIRLENSMILNSGMETYEFSIDNIKAKGKEYKEIIAVDVSEIVRKIKILESKNKEIEKLLIQYRQLKENIKEIVEERLKIRIKMNLHDTLGHQLSMIQAVTASERYDEIAIEKLNILELLDIYGDDSKYPPEDQLKDMKSFFKNLGINIYTEGKIPDDIEVAEAFIDITREATTNAIIHSGAINIDIYFKDNDENYELRVINDGEIPKEEIEEGGGIRGMRHKVKNLAGTLNIDSNEKFKLIVTIPKDKVDNLGGELI